MRFRHFLVLALLPAMIGVTGSPAAADTSVSPAMLAALQRDLGLTAAQARTRLADEARAARAEAVLSEQLGASYAGAHFEAGRLVVSTTTSGGHDLIRRAGAQPRVVSRSLQALRRIKNGLDSARDRLPGPITSWYVDVVGNSVVVTVHAPSHYARTDEFLDSVRADGLRVISTPHRIEPAKDIVGGQNIAFRNGGSCSIGFSAVRISDGGRRMITAGHCAEGATTVLGYDGSVLGSVESSVFGIDGDFGVTTVAAPWVGTPRIDLYNGGFATVSGSAEAPVGASVCRSGFATGFRCGVIEAKDQVIVYSWQGGYRVAGGLTRSTACSGPGDSGGAVFSGGQAQGLHSGATEYACSYDGKGYYQPINEVLTRYGLRLVTG